MKKNRIIRKTEFVIVLFLMILPLTACASAKNIARQALTSVIESSKEGSNDDWENDINLRYEAAIRLGDMELTKECIEEGADINCVQDKNTVLYALQNDNYDIAKYLIEQGADPNYIATDGGSLLMSSFHIRKKSYKKYMVTNALIEYGADINYKSPSGISVIDDVAGMGVTSVIDLEILISNGAVVSANTLKEAIDRVVMYIPTSKKPLRVEILGNIYGELALDRIKQKSKISIPEITEKRKKYMGQASMSGLFNFFSYLLILMALIGAADHYDNVIVGYFTRLVTQDYCILLLALGIGGLIVGKIYFMLGQYKLRKDINDTEHVRIRL